MSEVVMHLRRRYQCSTCPKSWSSRQTAERHAAECIHDPQTRACATCVHDVRGEPDGWEEPGWPDECEIGARAADERVVRHCEKWEPNRWTASLEQPQ